MLALAQFEVSFECISEISDDIEWKLIYVGSAESDEHDQLLDSVLVGPMQVSARPLPCACSSNDRLRAYHCTNPRCAAQQS